MNPETIVTKAATLTPVANRRLRNAGLKRNFMVKTPGDARQGNGLRNQILNQQLVCAIAANALLAQ
jgi:hypothetical protein